MPKTQRLSDATLVRRSQQGDRRAFGALVARYDWRLRGLAHALLLDPAQMDAALGLAYLRAWRDVVRIKPRDDVGPWLYRAAYNACIDQLRRSDGARPRPAAGDSSSAGGLPGRPGRPRARRPGRRGAGRARGLLGRVGGPHPRHVARAARVPARPGTRAARTVRARPAARGAAPTAEPEDDEAEAAVAESAAAEVAARPAPVRTTSPRPTSREPSCPTRARPIGRRRAARSGGGRRAAPVVAEARRPRRTRAQPWPRPTTRWPPSRDAEPDAEADCRGAAGTTGSAPTADGTGGNGHGRPRPGHERQHQRQVHRQANGHGNRGRGRRAAAPSGRRRRGRRLRAHRSRDSDGTPADRAATAPGPPTVAAEPAGARRPPASTGSQTADRPMSGAR